MYDLLTGPGLKLSIAVCLIGLVVRGVLYIKGLHWQLDRVAYTAHPGAGIRGALRSIFFWILPFGTRSWRTQPLMTVLFFGFHIGAVCIPLFLDAHTMILKKALGISIPSLNQAVADAMSWVVVASAGFLLLRRLVLPEVRILSGPADYLILLLSTAPFVTGLLCRYETGDYSVFLIIHILLGELLLIAIPFTRLSHILLFFLSRAQLGMDFGIKRGGMKGKGLSW